MAKQAGKRGQSKKTTTSTIQEKKDGLMAGYRVLDLTNERGLLCGALLGSLGADVIKIEKPGGDPSRNLGPFYHDIPDPEKSLVWYAYNFNKRGITLNIETIDGQELFKKLLKTADVVIESFDPGYMTHLGLGFPDLQKVKPDIILTSITPFGQTGPYKDYKSSNLSLWAMGGILFASGSISGGPAGISHVSHSYLAGSTDGAWSTAMALYWKEMTGKGQHLDVSIQESVESCTFLPHVAFRVTGEPMEKLGDEYSVLEAKVIRRWTWNTKDGKQILFAVSGGGWGARSMPPLIAWIESEGMADDYLKNINWSTLELSQLTTEERERIYGYFERFFASKTRAEITVEKEQRHIMIENVFSPAEAAAHPQLLARDYWQEVNHDELGVSLDYPSSFCRFSENACKVWRRAPLIGEHNQEVYGNELGYSAEEIIALKQNGVI